MRKAALLGAVVTGLLAGVLGYAQAGGYKLTELKPVSGDNSVEVRALTDAGDVLGLSSVMYTSGTTHHGIWHADGSFSQLGYQAFSMNNLGQTLGWDAQRIVTKWDAAGNVLATYGEGRGVRLGDNGAMLLDQEYDGFLGNIYYAPDGTRSAITPLPGYDELAPGQVAMNHVGQVIGRCNSWMGGSAGLIWSAQTGIQNLSALAGDPTFSPFAINDNGIVAGTFRRTDGSSGACVWSAENGLRYLSGISAPYFVAVNDINNRGQIVGSDSAGAWIADIDGSVTRIKELTSAWCINENGQIAGYAKLDGAIKAVLLDPVPEPSCVVAILTGCGLVPMLYRRRRTQ